MMPVMASDLHGTVESRLRATGQRYTVQRRRLIDILARAGSPVALPDILRGRRGLAQSSVYRNLADLEQAGVVRRVMVEDEHGRYELTEDLTGHHHHLICSSCGRVQDLPMPVELERTMDRTLDGLARSAGFAEVSHRLDLIGLCSGCAARGSAPTTA
jgi:Fur family transcriptional regulator, ferric uptake regulator